MEVLCFSLIVNNNDYQRVVFSQYSSSVFNYISSVVTETENYFWLAERNENLVKENVALKNQLEILNSKKDSSEVKPFVLDSCILYNYVDAKVVNATFNRTKNYLTLNRGGQDGVRKEMAVCSPEGVVGLIQDTSEHYSFVIPLINVNSRVSAKIKKNGYYGSLQWDGSDYRYSYLNDIPYHVEISPGDTIVTSGFSSIFPEGLLIGFVESATRETANFLAIKVRLAVDFKKLYHVYIVNDYWKDEKKRLEGNNYHE